MKLPARKPGGLYTALALFMMLGMPLCSAAAKSLPIPLSGNLQPVIERFLIDQTAGLPGKVSISINTPTSGALPACDAAEPFLPNGARLWGRVSVGIRCNAERPWTRYVQAYIAVVANYYVATRQINAGDTLAATDFTLREGDLSKLPHNVITNPSQLEGVVAINRIASGAPLRTEQLRGTIAIRSGQNVKVLTQGTGFVASTEGRAMSNAAVGATVQVKTSGGRLVSGIARENGTVELPN